MGIEISNDHPEAPVDGAYAGGHIRPANEAKARVDRHRSEHQPEDNRRVSNGD